MSQIILNGIALADLLNEFRAIVKDEVLNLTTTPPQPTTGKRYLTAKEAAEFLGIKQQTLYQNIEKIPSIKKHGKLFFVEAELIAYMEGGREQ
ncbi:MAG: helix-turn-helix domain-containing protein [Bacteroidetes bacterium]|nr:helix-turn-helix domain-containing protein [Bacteroidota bacterium]